QRAGDVVAIVHRRPTHRLSDVEKRGEVHDGGDLTLLQRRAQRREISDIANDEVAVLHRRAMTGDEVVVDDDAVAGAVQRLRRMAADVSRAPRDEDAAPISAQWRNM